jgi:3D (Asp-Asp-Asp) domain-containing protein
VAVLIGALLGAGGSALGQPQELQEPQAYRLKVDAVAYYLPGKTALGVPVRKGVVAVDPRLIPLGTKLHVPGYGPALAADVGYAIKGKIIDLWFPNTAMARAWGRQTVTITIYR